MYKTSIKYLVMERKKKSAQKIRYQETNLTKEVQDLYTWNNKSLLKKIKEALNKWKNTPCSWLQILNIIKMAIFPKLIEIQHNSHSILRYVPQPRKLIPVSIWNPQGNWENQNHAVKKKKKEHGWRTSTSKIWNLLQSNSNRDNVVLAWGKTYRSMERIWETKNKY